MCGCRLAIGERTICSACDMDLPRTRYQENPYGNDMAKLLWGRMPVERAAALFFYKPHSASSRIIHNLKYSGHPETGELMGRMAAAEIAAHGFFDGVDAIVPVPLARKRIRERGYNQAFEIARGISAVTRMPIIDKAVIRKSFKGSQTKMNRWQRNENVEGVFSLVDGSALTGKHILIIDDVISTGESLHAMEELVRRHLPDRQHQHDRRPPAMACTLHRMPCLLPPLPAPRADWRGSAP